MQPARTVTARSRKLLVTKREIAWGGERRDSGRAPKAVPIGEPS